MKHIIDSKSRQTFIVSREENIIQFLKELQDCNRRIEVSSLAKKSKFKGGSFSSVLADVKILGLVNNCAGVEINDDGKRFLEGDIEVRKTYYLKVPLFQEMYNQKIKTYEDAVQFIKSTLRDAYQTSTLEINSKAAGRRYLTGFFRQTFSSEDGSIQMSIMPTIKENGTVLDVLRRGMSKDEEIDTIVHLLLDTSSPLSVDSRKKILREVLKKKGW